MTCWSRLALSPFFSARGRSWQMVFRPCDHRAEWRVGSACFQYRSDNRWEARSCPFGKSQTCGKDACLRHPAAMGSIAVISPMISKSMRPQPRRPALGPNLVYSIHQHRRMRPPDVRKPFCRRGTACRPWFRIHPAERRVGQARHLVMAFTRSNGAGGCVTRR